ncbi:calmodulin-like protein containing EF hand [Trypanosoma theileri]|uniref:Calmodulin-like protein containing EF hand n=1 Tax=Trypanosoma theileri TaxID=67003 RepID=A0A1X0NYM5_9TRYP|nr:calmodulin-like protein containing EF hand [Trypanosoma theileri]ORC89794.1 calmodulin-like protein containing EF hand [Trypanosoma theileri]
MVFPVLACTDIRGVKINVELPFDEPPASLHDLHKTLEDVFRGEENAIRHQDTTIQNGKTRPSEPFTLSRVQRYEDDKQTWSELKDVRQLRAYDQLYVFRKNATKADISVQREIPAPRNSLYFPSRQTAGKGLGRNSSERGTQQPSSLSSPPPLLPQGQGQGQEEKKYQDHPLLSISSTTQGGDNIHSNGISHTPPPPSSSLLMRRTENHFGSPNGGPLGPSRDQTHNGFAESYTGPLIQDQIDTVFGIGDPTHKGYLTVRDFQSIFHACQIQFPPDVVEDLHRSFAKEKRGELIMSFHDFHSYARDFAQAINIAYSRWKNQERQKTLEREYHNANSTVDDLQMQKRALEERLEAIKKQLEREQEKKARLENEADEMRRLSNPDYRMQEQKLLDKEVSVFKYRQKLHQEEIDYERLAEERRRRTPSAMPDHLQAKSSVDRYGPRD